MLHIVDSLGLGGAQAVLKAYLDARGNARELHLLSLRRVPDEIAIAQANVHRYDSTSRFSLGALWRIRKLVRTQRIDVLHCHLFRSQVFGLLVKVLTAPRLRLVFHEHGRVVGREEPAAEAFAFRWFVRLASPAVDVFICNSEVAREGLLRLAPRASARTVVIPNPIAPATHPLPDSVRARQELGVPEGSFAIGFAGRLVEPKGWADFLEAAKVAASRLPIFFLLAGEGRDHSRVVSCIRDLDLEAQGRMLGHVRDMSTFYRALDCLVMPSRWEPHGLTQLEAQLHGVPVIVSDVPGMRSTVHADVDALLFQPGNAQDLARQIARLAADSALRERLVQHGIENAMRYSVDRFATGVETVYAGASGERPKGHPVPGASKEA